MNNPNQFQSITMSPEERDVHYAKVYEQIGAMGKVTARERSFASAVHNSSFPRGGEQTDDQAMPVDGSLSGGVPRSSTEVL